MLLDALADGDPSKWNYFEDLNCIEFLNLCVFYKDKQDEIARQRKLAEMRRK